MLSFVLFIIKRKTRRYNKNYSQYTFI